MTTTEKQKLPAPQRKEPPKLPPPAERKSHAWLWLLIFCALAGGGYYAYEHFYAEPEAAKAAAAAKKPEKPLPVVALPATTGSFPIYLEIDGTVTANNTVVVHSRVDGQIMKINFKEGQTVAKDDPLAEIDERPFVVQLEQAKGQLAKDTATLQNAEADLERYQKASEAIPHQTIDTAQATVNQAKGALDSDQAQIDAAKLQIVYCKITAPIAGQVGLRAVDEGNIIHAADPNGLVTIAQVHPIALDFNFPQAYLPAVQKAMHTQPKVVVDAFDTDIKKRLATGELSAIDNMIDPTSDTFRLKATFENEDNVLFPNQFVNVRLLSDTLTNVVLVPIAAVQTSPDSTFVYVVKSDDTVEMRNVVEGPKNDKTAVINHGLADGEIVVTDGLDKLSDGAKVSVRTDDQSAADTQSAATNPTTHKGTRKK